MPAQHPPKPDWSTQIRRLIVELKLSQAGFAARMGVSPATVNRWIKGTHEPTSASYLAMGNMAGSPDPAYFWERAGVDPANFPGTTPRMTISSLRVNLKDFKLVAGRKLSKEIVAKKANAVILPLLNITAYGDRIPTRPACHAIAGGGAGCAHGSAELVPASGEHAVYGSLRRFDDAGDRAPRGNRRGYSRHGSRSAG